MPYFPLLRRNEAMRILRDHDLDEQARGEMEAELGSSYFFSGASSADAMFLANEYMTQLRQDFEQSEEGAVFFAKLEAARLYEHVFHAEVHDLQIPEYTPGMRYGADTPFDDIPF